MSLPDRAMDAGPALIGREAETEALDQGLARAAVGDGGALLVVGDAGMGKTALLEQAAVRARAAGVRVAWATVPDAEGAPPYWPWTVVLRDLGAGGGTRAANAAGEALTTRAERAGSSAQPPLRLFH